MQDARDALMVARTSDGRLVQRPLSPHLQIYRRQITSVLSILHRLTGVALSVGTALLAWWLVAAATSDAAYADVSAVLRSPVGALALLGWIVSLWYHFFAGLRHLAWDLGYGFDIRTTVRTGWAVVGATVLATAGTLLAWAAA